MKIRTFTSCFAIILLLALFITPKAYAQEEGTLLPDISPQDIEIRGEFQARFLGLNRQPILGFDPNLQVYQIDPNRQPFMESGDQVVANLPVSELSRPAPPTYNALEYSEKINAFARAGVGSYSSPEVKFWGVHAINQQTYIGGDLDYSSSDGHLDDRPSSFRFLTANGEFGTRLNEKTDLRMYAGLQNDFNYPADFGEQSSLQESDKIKYQGFNGGVELERFANSISGWKLQGNIRSFDTNFETEAFPGSIDELVYNGSFSNRWALGNPGETITVKAGARAGNYQPQNSDEQQWSTLQGGVAYERLFDYETQLTAEADIYYASNSFEDKVYPGGILQVDHWFGDRLKVTGKAEAKPRLQTVEQLHQRNRFLGTNNQLRHSYVLDVTAEASLKYYRGSKLHGGVTYMNAQDYAYFEPIYSSAIGTGQASSGIDRYIVQYQNATNFKLFAGITHQLLPERFWVSGQVYAQNPKLSNDNEIPFKEKIGANASVSVRPIDRITIEGWADYVGERTTGPNTDNSIDGFFLVGGQLDVEIINNVGAYVKLVNALGEEYEVWQGYQERPFQVYGGLTIKL